MGEGGEVEEAKDDVEGSFWGSQTGKWRDAGMRRRSRGSRLAQGPVLQIVWSVVGNDQVHDQERLVQSCLECGVASLGQALVSVVVLHQLV